MNEPAIRPATASDLPAILSLLTDAGLILAGVADHLPGFLVATEGGAIVGTAGLEVYGNVALLRSVAVAPPQRRHGLGRRLVAAALGAARQRGVAQVALLTTTAASFFEHLGFRPITRDTLDPRLGASAELADECCASAVAMLLSLSPDVSRAASPGAREAALRDQVVPEEER
jgi:amino-acid N-acetyltransferase